MARIITRRVVAFYQRFVGVACWPFMAFCADQADSGSGSWLGLYTQSGLFKRLYYGPSSK